MPDKDDPYDKTEMARNKDGGKTTQPSHLEPDAINTNKGTANVSSPEGDDAGENRVTTSLSDA